jgi:hypothetical protein
MIDYRYLLTPIATSAKITKDGKLYTDIYLFGFRIARIHRIKLQQDYLNNGN